MSRIEDAGEKIGNARKDFSTRAMTLDDLKDMPEAQAIGLVTKDRVWPEPDWQAAVDAGLPIRQAAFAKLVRSRMAKAPVARGSGTAMDFVWRYVQAVGIIRDLLARPLPGSLADWSKAASLALTEAMSPISTNVAAVVPGNTRSFPHSVSYEDHARIDKMIAEGFPADVPAWRRNVSIREQRDGKFTVVRGKIVVGRDYETREKALAVAQESFGPKKKAASSTLPPLPPERPHLDHVERDGPDWREGRDVSAQDYVDILGFRGVEFGNWLPQGERQVVLNMGWDAIHDLADVMGVAPGAISLEGTLAAAFGSRGKGKAAAHYESGLKVFNLTRMSGAGSLAHEFAHALDNRIGEMSPDAIRRIQVRSATGWDVSHDVRQATAHMGEDFAGSMEDLMKRLRVVARTPEELKVDRDKELTSARNLVSIAEARLKGLDPRLKLAIEISKIVGERKERVSLLESEDFAKALPPSRPTEFMRNAISLDRERRKAYYTLPAELFARTFESWVFDRLQDQGRRCDYLVHGVEEERYADTELYRGNPYPTGVDRKDIGLAFDRMMDTLRPALEPGESPGLRVAV